MSKNNGDLWWSTTGATSWTIAAAPPAGNWLSGLTYGLGKYIAVGFGGEIDTSTDASDWGGATILLPGVDLKAITFGGNKFIIVGQSGKTYWSDSGAPLPCLSLCVVVWHFYLA